MNERVSPLKKLIISLITSLAFVLCTPYITQASPLAYATERIAGQDSVETALKISQKGWNSAQTVILCEYNDYPDSIAATPFAVNLDAPILLSKGNSLDSRVVKELQRLSPQKVILLGGTACLQPAIEKELDQLSLPWKRIGGIDRYETSVLLAKELVSDSLILANGDNFPDALSAATFAGIKQIPIVLTSTKLPASVIQYYQETAPAQLIVIGGEAVIPSAELNNHYFKISTRLSGYDRYGTNAAVASYMQDTYRTNDLFIASGITFPDAVAGTVLASKFKAPLLLTEKEDIPSSVYSIMRQHMKVEPPASNTGGSNNNGSDNNNAGNANTLFGQGTIAASGGLNLRESPSASGTVLTTVPEGTVVTLTDKQDQWYKTTYLSKTGWLSAAYLKVTLPKGLVGAAGGLNLRETPSATGTVLTTIPKGTSVELLDRQGQWYKATYQDKTGWIAADYVTVGTTGTDASQPANSSSTTASSNTPAQIDLSPNGKVYILGGTGIISANSQSIMEGKASSNYTDNLKDFPALPSKIADPSSPSRGDDNTPPDNNTPQDPPDTPYDPSQEVLINPFDVVPANALAGKTIMIDPGHGGPDPGAIGPTPTYEKNNTLPIALDLETVLKQAGAKVILTRDKDVALCSPYTETEDLQARVNLAEQLKPDLFISIHNDSFGNSAVQGTTTYYSKDNLQAYQSQQLAGCIQSAVIDTIATKSRGVKENALYVLRKTSMPAVLLETAFISNPTEEARLQNSTFRQNVANAVLIGIYNYYNKTALSGA